MQVIIDTNAIAAAVGAICGAAGTAIALGVRVAKPIRRALADWKLFHEDWNGEPARYDGAVPERPGMMKRIALIEQRQVEHEAAHQAGIISLTRMNGSEAA